jgi:hypothetical protein
MFAKISHVTAVCKHQSNAEKAFTAEHSEVRSGNQSLAELQKCVATKFAIVQMPV